MQHVLLYSGSFPDDIFLNAVQPQPLRLIKTIDVENVDVRQTLLILPAAFMKLHVAGCVAQFQEIGNNQVLVRLLGPGERLLFKAYKLVTSHEASWTSIPRGWLRNIGARQGDKLDLYETPDPKTLLLRYRTPLVNP
jgi:hypothetical protein